MLGIVLRTEGFEPSFVADGDRALSAFRATKPDLVLLDLMLPGTDGIDICRQIRAESGTPIVMLTARGDTVDVVLGLECGADDYIIKPFKPKELVARVRARLRRNDTPSSEVLEICDVTIDVAGHVVSRDGAAIGLTPLEFDLLNQIRDGLLQAKTRAALVQLDFGLQHAADQFSAGPRQTDVRTTAAIITADLAGRGSDAQNYGVAIVSTTGGDSASTADILPAVSIPTKLFRTAARQQRDAWAYT